MQFAMPDILYWEEIEPGTPGLEALGLKILEVRGEYVRYASELPDKYGTAPSPNDYLALALARQEDCPLLSGSKPQDCGQEGRCDSHGDRLVAPGDGREPAAQCG